MSAYVGLMASHIHLREAAEDENNYLMNLNTGSYYHSARSLPSLLLDFIFGQPPEDDDFNQIRPVANIQATVLILIAAMCLLLAPSRKPGTVGSYSELKEMLSNASSFGVMLIGTSISVVARNRTSPSSSADTLFSVGFGICLGCLGLGNAIAFCMAKSARKRICCLALCASTAVCMFLIAKSDGNLSVVRQLYSGNRPPYATRIEPRLIDILPGFAGLSVCFSLGFACFFSYEFDSNSMGAVGTMCLLQTAIAGSSVLRSIVVSQAEGFLAQTSFAFILGMIVLGTMLLLRLCEIDDEALVFPKHRELAKHKAKRGRSRKPIVTFRDDHVEYYSGDLDCGNVIDERK